MRVPHVSRGQYMSQQHHSWAKQSHDRASKAREAREARVCVCMGVCVHVCVSVRAVDKWVEDSGQMKSWQVSPLKFYRVFMGITSHTQILATRGNAESWELGDDEDHRTRSPRSDALPLSQSLQQTERQFHPANFITTGIQPKPFSWNPLRCEFV